MAKFMDVHSACIVQQLREAHEKALAIEADKADKPCTRADLDGPQAGEVLCAGPGLRRTPFGGSTSTHGRPTAEVYKIPIDLA